MNRLIRALSRPHRVVMLALTLATAGLVWSWVPTGDTWPTGSASFRINTNFPVGEVGSAQDQIDLIRCAASAWRTQGQTNFQFFYLGTTTSTAASPFDSVDSVLYSAASGGGSTLAVTSSAFIGSTSTGFDITFFGQDDFGDIVWNGAGDTTASQADILGVGVHEFGHALGLGHPPIAGATMFEFYSGLPDRTLHPDDIAGVQDLYGANLSISDQPEINDVTPPTGDIAGGFEIVIDGDNFTWDSNTTLRVDGVIVSSGLVACDSMCRIRILSMPAHAAGPVSIRITNELGDSTIDDAFTYTGAPPIGAATISILGGGGSPGASGVEVETVIDSDFDFSAYSFGVTFDPAEVAFEEATVDGTDADGADFVAVNFDNVEGWWTLGVALDIVPPIVDFIPSGLDRVAAITDYAISSSMSVGDFISLNAVGGVGDPPIAAVVSNPSGTSITPALQGGLIIVQAGGAFVRGDGNGDGAIDIADPIFNLDYLFSGGSSFCADSQDTNDDGAIDIADPIYNLAFLFSSGPPPPAPYPGAGSDPTADGLGC